MDGWMDGWMVGRMDKQTVVTVVIVVGDIRNANRRYTLTEMSKNDVIIVQHCNQCDPCWQETIQHSTKWSNKQKKQTSKPKNGKYWMDGWMDGWIKQSLKEL